MNKDINPMFAHLKLQFVVDNPDLEECYAYGYQAALSKISEDQNPYNSNSCEFEQWQEGWWAGFYGEQPLFETPLLAEAGEEVMSLEQKAANDKRFVPLPSSLMSRFARVTSAIAATALVGYQVIDLVA